MVCLHRSFCSKVIFYLRSGLFIPVFEGFEEHWDDDHRCFRARDIKVLIHWWRDPENEVGGFSKVVGWVKG